MIMAGHVLQRELQNFVVVKFTMTINLNTIGLTHITRG